MMATRKQKPPTPRSVSATLRAAGFKAIGDGDEGYEAAWFGAYPATAAGVVHVRFCAYRGDGTSAAIDEARELEHKALAAMAAVLRHKGWAAEERESGTYLIVKEAGR